MGTYHILTYFRELALDVVNGFKAARRQRARIRDVRDEEERLSKLRARILAIGTLRRLPNGDLTLVGWSFDMKGDIPVSRLGLDGVTRFCGYTAAELTEIYARRSEFVDASSRWDWA